MLALTIVAASSLMLTDDLASHREPTVVPFTVDQIFGSRPVVDALVNGKPYRLVIHANAGSYLQLNHADAQNVAAYNLKHQGAYGISKPGRVSDLGRDDGLVNDLELGNWKMPTVPIAVFEVPNGGSKGMLGLPFLHGSSAILDFGKKRLLIPDAKPDKSLAAEIAERGYAAIAMKRDAEDGRYLVKVTINGVQTPMVVSTVASVDLDTGFAARAGVPVGAVVGSYGGPSGATGNVYETATPITIQIGDWTSEPAKVNVQDAYAYSKVPRPVDPKTARGGTLGADFMIAHSAVIDFGNLVLYLKDHADNQP